MMSSRRPHGRGGAASSAAPVGGATSSAVPPDHDPAGVEPLFCGKSIFTRLAESAFGEFSRAIAGVALPDAESSFSLPRVVVIGCEKSGKSTLLESLTKCPIFPRADGGCLFRLFHEPPAHTFLRFQAS